MREADPHRPTFELMASPKIRYWLMQAGSGASEWTGWNAEGVATLEGKQPKDKDLRQ